MLKHLKMYYFLVALPYFLLLAGAVVFFDAIKRTVLNNPIPHLNYAIFVIVLTGGIIIINNVRRLVGDARKMVEFSEAIHAKTDTTTLRAMANGYTGDLACILMMIATSGDRSISHQEQAALEHELANARSRLVRRNALPQYLTGLLVAMGLLGTFIGLLATLADISVLIGSFAEIDMNNIDPIQVFRVMIERMKAPMTSMGIAFSTSMFGLLGSIVIGLMMLGIRRLQGDIISMLSSEMARHIEIALSFESISFREGGVGSASGGGDLTAKILLRIEERLAEASRSRQRALTVEIDDFKKQRAEMLQVLTAQTEASNNFRSELQHLTSQLGSILNDTEKRTGEISSQISELTVHMAGDAKETHKLLATQVDEQQKLKAALDSYSIQEWLAETARMQQRSLSIVIEDFKNQRADMLHTLTEQTEASRNFRNELQHLGSQLGSIFNSMEKSNADISSQISELTIHNGADAKESHRLLSVTSNNLRGELQQLGSRLGTIANLTEKGQIEIAAQISELMNHMGTEAKESQLLLESGSKELRDELQQLGSQLGSRLGTIASVTEKGNGEVAAQISGLMEQMNAEAKESQQLLESSSKELRNELQQLGSQFGSRLGTIADVTEKGNGEVAAQISRLMEHMNASTKESQQLLEGASKELRSELQQLSGQLGSQLGSQLGTISNVVVKGGDELTIQITELMAHMAADAKESHKLLSMMMKEEESLPENEQQE